ncbi:hypothetical protein ACQP1K_12155 [Sphaerimonospora sp. CA-214678]|uniref:hypothetical protein n=1 Tax=Sphaerimonospora sp. CA-214678 TaxID=3240029 RepID=UPI003D8D6F21
MIGGRRESFHSASTTASTMKIDVAARAGRGGGTIRRLMRHPAPSIRVPGGLDRVRHLSPVRLG